MERSPRGAANGTAASQRRVWRGCKTFPDPEGRRGSRGRRPGIRKETDGRQYRTVGGARELISKVTGAAYSVSSVYRTLRRRGYFLRAPVKRHARRPPDGEIARFQKELAELMPKKIGEGYTVAVQDETVVTAGARPGRVYTRKGRRAVRAVTGSHGKTVAYGLQTVDGRGMCAQHDRFTTENFADFLKKARRRFPRMAMILDRAPQHTARIARQTAEDLGGRSWSVSRRDARISTRWGRSGGR